MLSRLGFPDIGGHRRFVGALAIDAIGGGVFMPLSIIYFVRTTHLSFVEVGQAMSIAALVGVPLVPLVGQVVDRVGAKPMLLIGNVVLTASYLGYLVTSTWWTVLVALIGSGVGTSCFWGSYGPLVASITKSGERETWFGFLQAMRNLGFAVGGLASGVALSIGTPAAMHAVVLTNIASFVIALVLLLGVHVERPAGTRRDGPLAVPDDAADHDGPDVGVSDSEDAQADPAGWGVVLRDRPYLLAVANQLMFALNAMMLNFAMPVYATEVLHLPGWVTGAIFTINTIMVGFGQGLAVRRMVGHARWRMLVAAYLLTIGGYALLAGAGPLPVWPAVTLVLLGVGVYTLGELAASPILSTIGAEGAPERLRGRYMSVMQLSWTIAGIAAPGAFTWLLGLGTVPVWAIGAMTCVVGVLLSRRVGRVLPAATTPVTAAN